VLVPLNSRVGFSAQRMLTTSSMKGVGFYDRGAPCSILGGFVGVDQVW